ncbi:hypothetical protein MMC10_010825 [Thelotrema lepadinum]|nr:hypothetical protein [Thelotrema lepadinum]
MNTGRRYAETRAKHRMDRFEPGVPRYRQPDRVRFNGALREWLSYEQTPEEERMVEQLHRDLQQIQRERTSRYPRWKPIQCLRRHYSGGLQSEVDGRVFRTAEEVWEWAEQVAEQAERRAEEWNLFEQDKEARIPSNTWQRNMFCRKDGGGNRGQNGPMRQR